MHPKNKTNDEYEEKDSVHTSMKILTHMLVLIK